MNLAKNDARHVRQKTKSIGSPDPMDAFLGLYDAVSPSDVEEDDDDEIMQQISTLNGHTFLSLPPEPQAGNVEYKLKLVNPSQSRFEHLVTQMKWRLREGQGEAIYEIGVEDSGSLQGLSEQDMEASLVTLEAMASRLGASTSILRRRSLSQVDVEGNVISRSVAEALVRKVPDDQHSIDIRVAVLGNAEVGKSTLIGVLTQGQMDNGRGSARLNLFRHLHEVQSGRTSSISHEILGFDEKGGVINYVGSTCAEDICALSSKLITFIDLAGHQKYLRTTIRGLTSYEPHYVALVVSATCGVTATTREHLGLALALEVPVVIVMTKIDVAMLSQQQAALEALQSLLKAPGICKAPWRIENDDDVMAASSQCLQGNTVPIFAISSVTGNGLDLLTKFLYLLPPGLSLPERQRLEQLPTLFQVYETIRLDGVGTVLGGLLSRGILQQGDKLIVGPLENGLFKQVKIHSIHRYKRPCRLVHAGQSASIVLSQASQLDGLSPRRGLILAHRTMKPRASLFFQASIVLLFHTRWIQPGFQTTIHIGSVRQTVVLEGIMAAQRMATNDRASVLFRFLQHPEFLEPGMRLVFRTGSTKGIGKVTQVFPIDWDDEER